MKCLFTNACSTGRNQEKLELCVQLRGYSLTRMKEMGGDSLQDWSAAMDGYRVFRKGKPGGPDGELPFKVKESGNALP